MKKIRINLQMIYNELKINPKITQVKLAEKYNVCERTIRRYYKVLKDNGYIIQYNSGRKTEWYIINDFKE